LLFVKSAEAAGADFYFFSVNFFSLEIEVLFAFSCPQRMAAVVRGHCLASADFTSS